MSRRSFLAACLAAALCAASGAPAAAQSAQQQQVPAAAAFVERLAQRAIEGLTARDIDLDERTKRFRELLTESFDVPKIGRFALGTAWRTAAPPDREAYLKAFEDFIVATYATRFADYGGETIRVVSSRRLDEGEAAVGSVFERARGEPVRVDWRLAPEGQSWKIIDVIIEGVSMAITQRDDFSATVQRNGGRVGPLIDQLREKARPTTAQRS
ncbi:MAG: ABC transporter substrate-binding protein [Azospirillum sp.]|nr:ABC transporter substrate-binding protein [Azospirillum sp.]MCA3267274.1 ABC transporter substrate-binding protein [Azospirillum sp.]